MTADDLPEWVLAGDGTLHGAIDYWQALSRERAATIATLTGERDALRAVVAAADAMRADAYQEDMSSVGCPPYMVDRPTSVALAYDAARKEVTP